MADLTDSYTLRRHRSLPPGERATWCYLMATAEDVQRYREEAAQATGAALDGSSEGPSRQPVERVEDSFALRLVARHLRRVEGLTDPGGAPLDCAGLDYDGRLDWIRVHLPLRVVGELSRAVSGEIDPEEE